MAELNLGHVVGPGVPTGGTSGQVLKKNSSTNFDTSWTNNDATTIPMSSSDSTSISQVITNTNPGQSLASNVDLDTVLTPGKYYASSNSIASTITHRPSKYNGATRSFSVDVVQVGASSRIMQIYYDCIDNMPFIRHLYNGVVTADWEELAPRSETQNLIPQRLMSDADATISRNIYIGTNARFFIDCFTNNINACFSIMAVSNSSGAIQILEKVKGANVTFDMSTAGVLNVTFTDSRQCYYMIWSHNATKVNEVTITAVSNI